MWSKAKYNVCKVFEELRKKTRLNDIGSITRASCCVATGDYSLTILLEQSINIVILLLSNSLLKKQEEK